MTAFNRSERGRAAPWKSREMGIHFLISNDDGLHAGGIAALAKRCRALGRVTIVAPDKDRSGASNSLTLDAPVRIREIDDQTFEVTENECDEQLL